MSNFRFNNNGKKIIVVLVFAGLTLLISQFVYNRHHPPLGEFVVKGKKVFIRCYPGLHGLVPGKTYSTRFSAWSLWVLSDDTAGCDTSKKALATFVSVVPFE